MLDMVSILEKTLRLMIQPETKLQIIRVVLNQRFGFTA